MKTVFSFLLWILLMVVASFVGVFGVYLYWDKQVPESTMVIAAIGGIVTGLIIAIIRKFKQS